MMRGLLALYSRSYSGKLVSLWTESKGLLAYYRRYWSIQDFSKYKPGPKSQMYPGKVVFVRRFLMGWLLLQAAGGLLLIWLDIAGDFTGGWQFGTALLLAYPLVLAHILPLFVGLWWVLHPKALARSAVCRILEGQVRRLRRLHSFDVVAVVGSVGKTSTKMAIARLLQASRRVQWQEGNYNDRVTVPLIFFGQSQPPLLNVAAWFSVFLKNESMLRKPYPYQVVVIEMGVDKPGYMTEFSYLRPDLTVVTAVTPEHMEYFKTLDAVAAEELAALHFSKQALINIDDVPARYLSDLHFASYGLRPGADYHASKREKKGLTGQAITFHLQNKQVAANITLAGEHGAKIALAAVAAADLLKIPQADIAQGITQIRAFAGRMHILPGIKNSTIIDDTYNATPIAVKAALDVLTGGGAPQRIAILGSMNELGSYSPEAHREVGEHCDPSMLDLVVTIGQDANSYLAPVAKKRGCTVKTFTSPYKAGAYVKKQLREGAVVLAKGSQNGVFAEEAIKRLLANAEDASKLVRQSDYWLKIKQKQFKD